MIQSTRRRSNLLLVLVAFVALAVVSSSLVDAANLRKQKQHRHNHRRVKNDAAAAANADTDTNKKPIEQQQRKRRNTMEAKSKSFREEVLAPKKHNVQPKKKETNVAAQASNRHNKVATSRSKIPRDRRTESANANGNAKKNNAKKIIRAKTDGNNDTKDVVDHRRRAAKAKGNDAAAVNNNNGDNDQDDIWDSLVGNGTSSPLIESNMDDEEHDEYATAQTLDQTTNTSNLRQRRRLRSVAAANAGTSTNTQRKAANFRDQVRAVMMMKDSYETR